MTGSVDVFVCVSCRKSDADGEGFHNPGRAFAASLQQRLAGEQSVVVTPVECLAVCNRPCTVAFSSPGKWMYLIGNLEGEAHVEQIAESARAYLASENGIIPWKERPEAFRKGVVARVPPNGFSHPVEDPS